MEALLTDSGARVDGATAPDGFRDYFEHPYVVFRVAGLPFSAVSEFGSGDALRLLREIGDIRQGLDPKVGRACDFLEKIIGSDELSDDDRRQLIKLRRDLFNHRDKDHPLSDGARLLLAAEGERIVSTAKEAIGKLAARENDYAVCHGDELLHDRQVVRGVCRNSENFLKALAFSAPKCIADLLAAEQKPDKYRGKRGRNLDGTLFNYFLRASTKVSPLTYFTPIALGRWSDEVRPSSHDLSNRDVRNDVQLSRRVIDQILCALSQNLKFWGEDHPLLLNPTLREQDGVFEFEKSWDRGEGSARVWGTQPPVGRIAANGKAKALAELYASPEGLAAGRTIRQLHEDLCDAQFAGDTAAFVRFVAQALKAAILVPSERIFDQEIGPEWLAELVEDKMPELAVELRSLIDLLSAYRNAAFDERVGIRARIAKSHDMCLEMVGEEKSKREKSVLLYEDCFLNGPVIELPGNFIGSAPADTHRLSAIFPLLDFTHLVQSITAAIFVDRFGENRRVRVSDCMDQLSAEAQAFAQRVSPLPLEEQRPAVREVSRDAETVLRLKDEFLSEISEMLSTGKNVVLTDELIDRYDRAIPDPIRARPTSYTVIGQADGNPVDPRRGDVVFAINRLYSGHSMLASRFLSQLPEDHIAAVSDYVRRLADGRTPVELPGVFGFNANLHPRFVDTEISLPGRRPNYRDAEKLSLNEIWLQYDPRLDRLRLAHEQLGEISAHYFGFLVLMMLPNAHQLLGRTNMQGLILDLWQDLKYSGKVEEDRVAILPRVAYRSLVFMRRSIFIPDNAMPDPDLPESDFFRKFHDLLESIGEGVNFFARLVANQEDIIGGEEGLAAMGETTDFKPSYLSLGLPLTVAALQRRLRRRNRTILLQEPFPVIGEGGVDWNGERHACEIQFEISRSQSSAD